MRSKASRTAIAARSRPASVLEPVYESMGEWQKLISVLEVQVRFVEDPYQKVELLHRIARLYEENLGDHARAFETYARAVEADSQNEETLLGARAARHADRPLAGRRQALRPRARQARGQ